LDRPPQKPAQDARFRAAALISTLAFAVVGVTWLFWARSPGEPPRVPPELGASAPLAASAEPRVAPAVNVRLAEPSVAPRQTPSAASLSSAAPPALDEMSLLRKLRELRGSDPSLSLELAREGQARFKDGPDVAELSWFVVKSLSELGRHDEASVEGRKLVHDFPGNSFADDVHRHLFVNPPTHPSERGYGKTLEGE